MSWWRYAFFAVLAVVVTGLLYILADMERNEMTQQATTDLPQATVRINGVDIAVEVANNPITRQQGLSNRAYLAENQGLFFIFEAHRPHGIWMKDMRFPIDILWFDENFQLIHAEQNIAPDTYPTVFRPFNGKPALYVLEMNAGFVDAHQIQIGDVLTFIGQEGE